jgi:hypothetical protein
MVWKGRLMNQSGRLTLIKTTLSTVLIYTSISIYLTLCLLRALEKIMKVFLWSGTVSCRAVNAWWLGPMLRGHWSREGWGSFDLRRMGMALQLR